MESLSQSNDSAIIVARKDTSRFPDSVKESSGSEFNNVNVVSSSRIAVVDPFNNN